MLSNTAEKSPVVICQLLIHKWERRTIQTDAPGSNSLHIYLGVNSIIHSGTAHQITANLPLATSLKGPICYTKLYPYRQHGACETSGLQQNSVNAGFPANDGNYLMIDGTCGTSILQLPLTESCWHEQTIPTNKKRR